MLKLFVVLLGTESWGKTWMSKCLVVTAAVETARS
jgi:hypothetical protein